MANRKQKNYYIMNEKGKYLKIKPNRTPNLYWTSLIYATSFEQDTVAAKIWLQIAQSEGQQAKIVEI